MYDVQKIRADFPILSRQVNGKPLVYAPDALSAQSEGGDRRGDAGLCHWSIRIRPSRLSNFATEKYEAVRGAVPERPVRGRDRHDLGMTEGINLVAYGRSPDAGGGRDRPERDGAPREHRAVALLREAEGVVLEWVDVDATRQKMIDAIGPRTRLVAVTHMSNVLGSKVDVKAITAAAHGKGVRAPSDGVQRPFTCPWTCRIWAAT